MATTPKLKAILTLDSSPFLSGISRAMAVSKALAMQFKNNPVKFMGTAALLGMEKGLRGAASGMKALGSYGLGAATAGIKNLAIAAPLAAAGFSAGVAKAFDFGSQLQDMSDRTGIGVKHLVVLQTALKDAGIEFDALLPAIGKMQSALVKEAAGEGDGLFAKLGLDARALKEADPGETFGKVMEKIGAIKNAAERADISKRLFGKSGLTFLSMARDPNAMENARQAVGSQADILGANAGVFDRISDVIGHAPLKIRGFFVGVADGLSAILTPLLERLDKIDLAAKGRAMAETIKEAAVFFVASFNYVKDVATGPIGKIFTWIGKTMFEVFSTIAATLQAVMEVVTLKLTNAVRGIMNAWDMMTNLGQGQQAMIEDKESFGAKVKRYKKGGGTWSLAGAPTGSGMTFEEHMKQARAGFGAGAEGPAGAATAGIATTGSTPWRLQGFGSRLGDRSSTLQGAGMNWASGFKGGGLAWRDAMLSPGAEGKGRLATFGMGDGPVGGLLRHAEMRGIRNKIRAAGGDTMPDGSKITDIAAGDARRRKAFQREEARKLMAKGSDNQLLSSITKNTAAAAKRLGIVFGVNDGAVEGA